jgi:hypothetical protein
MIIPQGNAEFSTAADIDVNIKVNKTVVFTNFEINVKLKISALWVAVMFMPSTYRYMYQAY